MAVKKCLDTYALIEIARGNERFVSYFNEEFIIPDLTLAEFYGVMLRDFNEQTAEYWYKKLFPYTRPVPLPVLIGAIKFRFENRKDNISFFDAVGYVFSLSTNCFFVTGDRAFEKKEKVEYKKAKE